MMPWPTGSWAAYPEHQPAEEKPAGDIFEEEVGDERLKAVNKYLGDLDTAARFQIIMMTEMLDVVTDENNQLREEILRLQNELDREKKKKLQTP